MKPISQASVIFYGGKLRFIFAHEQGYRNVLVNWIQSNLFSLKVATQIPVCVDLESLLLQILGEVEEWTKRTSAWIVTHVDHVPVPVVEGRVQLHVGIKNGAH